MLINSQPNLRWGVAVIAVWVFSCIAVFAKGDIHLPQLKTETVTYTNVTVTSVNETQIFITHSRGMGSVKVSAIQDDDALIAMGLKEAKKESIFSGTNSPTTAALNMANEKLEALREMPAAAPVMAQIDALRSQPLPKNFILYAGLAALAIHLLYSLCLRMICVKAATDPGVLVWLPILQLIPMFRAAGMSAWWFVGMLVPLLNLIGAIMWCFKIAAARGKSALVGIALLLPVTNFFAFLYLAFSSATHNEDGGKVGLRSVA